MISALEDTQTDKITFLHAFIFPNLGGGAVMTHFYSYMGTKITFTEMPNGLFIHAR